MADSKTQIKTKNRNRVYRYVLDNGSASFSGIANALNISLPTAVQHVGFLVEQKLLRESGVCESTGGRRAKIIEAIPNSRVAFGVSITNSTIRFVLIDLKGNVIDVIKEVLPFSQKNDYYRIISEYLSLIRQKHNLPKEAILGVGVSLPAIVNEEKMICDTAFDMVFPRDFLQRLGRVVPYPVNLFNDATGGGYAEFWHADHCTNRFYINISDSIGGAICIHGKPYDGEDMRSAEIGHITLVPDGRLCYCGRRGCLAAYCSTNVLKRFPSGRLRDFFALLEQNNEEAARIWSEYLDCLAIAINDIRMLFDCNVSIGGKLAEYLPRYLDDLNRRLRERDSFSRQEPYITISAYSAVSSAVGAALTYIDSFIEGVGAE